MDVSTNRGYNRVNLRLFGSESDSGHQGLVSSSASGIGPWESPRASAPAPRPCTAPGFCPPLVWHGGAQRPGQGCMKRLGKQLLVSARSRASRGRGPGAVKGYVPAADETRRRYHREIKRAIFRRDYLKFLLVSTFPRFPRVRQYLH